MAAAHLNRFAGGFLRYWAVCIDMVHAQNQDWPGFSYTDEEKAELTAIAKTARHFGLFLAINTLIFMMAALAVVLFFFFVVLKPPPQETTDAEFYTGFGLILVLMLGVVMPLSMSTSAAIVSLSTGAPQMETAAHAALYRKALGQFARIGLFGGGAIAVLGPATSYFSDSTTDVLRVVLHLAMPLVGGLTLLFLLRGRRAR